MQRALVGQFIGSTRDVFDCNGNTQTIVNSAGTTTYAWDFTDQAVASGSRRTPRAAGRAMPSTWKR